MLLTHTELAEMSGAFLQSWWIVGTKDFIGLLSVQKRKFKKPFEKNKIDLEGTLLFGFGIIPLERGTNT